MFGVLFATDWAFGLAVWVCFIVHHSRERARHAAATLLELTRIGWLGYLYTWDAFKPTTTVPCLATFHRVGYSPLKRPGAINGVLIYRNWRGRTFFAGDYWCVTLYLSFSENMNEHSCRKTPTRDGVTVSGYARIDPPRYSTSSPRV